MFSTGSCSSNDRNDFEVNVWKINDDQWTQEKQKKQTKLAKSSHPHLKELTFGDEDCNIAVRANMQKEPLISNCRPTLK